MMPLSIFYHFYVKYFVTYDILQEPTVFIGILRVPYVLEVNGFSGCLSFFEVN